MDVEEGLKTQGGQQVWIHAKGDTIIKTARGINIINVKDPLPENT